MIVILGLVAPRLAVPQSQAAPVIVSSKLDTEGALLGAMMAIKLRAMGLAVEERIGLGPTSILRQAILAGQIDLYPEYTGNASIFFHEERDPVWRVAAEAYRRARDLDRANDLVWLPPAPADNSWAIALRADLSRTRRLVTLHDLAAYLNEGGRLRLAASAEFVEAPGALPAFQRAYGFRLSGKQLLILAGGDTAATIRAAAEAISGVNAAMAYGTDGALAALGLVVLADDAHAQLVYQPAPLIRRAVLELHPGIARALAPVFASLESGTLRQLNARIAVDGEEPHAVALSYLKQRGLL